MIRIGALSKRLAYAFFMLLCLQPYRTASAQNCTYFVSPTGSDTNSGTLITAPFATAQKAFDTAIAGQTVCFRGGVYPQTVVPTTASSFNQTANNSGTAGNVITYTNYQNEVADIQGSTRVNGSFLTFTGSLQGTGSCSAAHQCGLIFEGSQVLNGQGSAYVIGAVSVCCAVNSNPHNVTFDHVEIKNGNFHYGFYEEGCDNAITNSYVHDNGTTDRTTDNGIYWSQQVAGTPATACAAGHGGLIANNISEHNFSKGIQLFDASSATEPANVAVVENTVVNNGSYGLAIWGDNNAVVSNLLYGNNAAVNPTDGNAVLDSGATQVIDHNFAYNPVNPAAATWFNPNASCCITNPHDGANPLFVNASALDWHLKTNSPAVADGTSTDAQPKDHDSVLRRSPPAAGAYELPPPPQDASNPSCGVNNNGTNIVPSGPSVTRINGTTTVSWHDFVTQPLAVGDYWTDLAYGCFSKMLTNSRLLNAAQSQQYALSSAMDKGDCYVMAQNPDSGNSSQFVIAAPTQSCSGGFGTWGQTVLSSAQMPARTSHNEFVWDYFTQGKFWFANNNTIGFCTITGIGTTACSTAHTFAEYASGGCNFIDYAAMNQNGFIDTFCQATSGGVMDIFMYDTVHDVKSAVYTTACTGTLLTSNQPGCVHKIAITPNNGILVQFNGNVCGNESGNHYWAFPTPANPMPQIECKTDHVDVAGDFTTGQDRAFYEDFQDNPGPWTGCTFGFKPTSTLLPLLGNPLCVFDQSNTNNFNAGWDISTRAWPARAWILYSMQDGSNNTTVSPATNCNNNASYADPSSSNWSNNGVGRLENELLLVRADAGGNFAKIWRLGLTHQRGVCDGNNFYADPRAPQSMDGNYIVFATNARWGASGGGPGASVDIVVMGGSVNVNGVLGPLFGSTLAPPTNLRAVPIIQPLLGGGFPYLF